MDSLTQVALGASVAVLCAPKKHMRSAALVGAVLGTLPDLDVLIRYDNAVANFTYHRGFSHSLFVLSIFSLMVFALAYKFSTAVRDNPKPWFWAIFLALITHPLLDAHTAYGTQIFWPLDIAPAMWSTLFIIDPLYTFPLVVLMVFALWQPKGDWVWKAVPALFLVSNLYLSWTWVAKWRLHDKVTASLPGDPQASQIFSAPTPFNSIAWRVVVLQDTVYFEGYHSFMNFSREIEWRRFDLGSELLQANQNWWAIQRLDWFAQGFNQARLREGQLVVSDLRMGFAGNYVFNHVVGSVEEGVLVETKSTLAESQLSMDDLPDLIEMIQVLNE